MVGEMNGTEEVVKCVQPPLQEVMVRVDVVKVVKVTRKGQWLDVKSFDNQTYQQSWRWMWCMSMGIPDG